MANKKVGVKGKEVHIDWHFPENMNSKYATNLIVQHNEHEFVLSFFEIAPPIVLGQKDLDIDSVNAECVSRIVIAPSRIEEFITVLQRNLEMYKTNILDEGDK